ncbi:DUF6774 domain-containing protein [Clostridium merdae]|uniref:DUF6774 domain-containing protein n=1 Tax=Clostridium merdae TaxID=1958780 RepID=UPI00117EED6C|nr:DUF6774 domain-containing protein [Clostridium merdae]
MAAATIAMSISQGRSANEINIMSSIFTAIGDNLAIIAAKEAACSDTTNTSNTANTTSTTNTSNTASTTKK